MTSADLMNQWQMYHEFLLLNINNWWSHYGFMWLIYT